MLTKPRTNICVRLSPECIRIIKDYAIHHAITANQTIEDWAKEINKEIICQKH